ncbi:tRNA (adenine-N1)-methyltransferase [Natranaerofaba carboxydovora]|uniref:tRNA (adenine-N1)-methyltransferase n=1 Tax=Natranaerofaba carboxydovora TaxID=2742683 RepID=UPI001F148478|nr:tRNA (adenine-N1)-methyltransferase [Natranaerofaba carboxydovora]UMZ73125.1 tRNA (adenine(58)-N(1))-methyltransferase TrmI [Natranaerofaba carboxydovora]
MEEFKGGLKEKVMITDRKKFTKIFDLNNEFVQLPTGNMNCEELRSMEKGSSFVLNGREYIILDCDLQDYIMKKLTRKTQIIYPKDAGYILIKLDIFPGKIVGEAGTGSAALTNIFSRAVGNDGKVITFERREDFKKIISKNLAGARVFDNVEVINTSLVEASEIDVEFDAFFLDVREPWNVLDQVYKVLKPSGHLGIFVPTTNQIEDTLKGLDKDKFYLVEVTEIMIRKYKDNSDRIRPEDTMIGHTGYLIFARKLA